MGLRYSCIALHCVANNLINKYYASEILCKFDRLVSQIKFVNPNVYIVISGILPRGETNLDVIVKQSYIDEINRRAREVNRDLIDICSRDGLHLHYRGIDSVVYYGLCASC